MKLLLFSSKNLRTVRPKVYIAFFFHGSNSCVLCIILWVFAASDYSTVNYVDYVIVMAYGTHEGKKGQMEAGIRVGTDKSVLSFSHLIR